ncbi:hypothetical protein BJ085DRAFT_28936 [Dimargaris cristalligena]|uniref:Uncharacterized protein n=1 Tax=Dimargaris cristalligena TaxID=215637 RepID=A0A4P9ZJL4_9FUNG|nr:hypothetical protein BJ085DRAFT_28936 [Dimargaris cristalligena]|eukprot:RKP33404.1 hypothetical protein BJ085DRAFT_28936 [Dimargaris cristalligena]
MALPVPNSDDGSLGLIHVEYFLLYPSTSSKHSSNPIRIAEGLFPEFTMFCSGTLSPPNLTSSDPANSGEGKGSNPSLSPGREGPQTTGLTSHSKVEHPIVEQLGHPTNEIVQLVLPLTSASTRCYAKENLLHH